ncbi:MULTISPECIES: FCD domain-containing protein [unclassified Bradyrhizobium]|uniref:GntR family transcriptional regulator n=1 Tax=unclassified Bradyrhizobium TaxID=2631580 RepID=UPI0024788C6C|nr:MULTISPECIES: FCD domain-containing protein [unclassified Bradyrhizobium]WGR73133.1 FCD domain-containing protein [Bradyrhizobium sp. ISRA426]WGR77973.1 FCD domain-containing protein [Bradyrhizobium sp. ISRA430]WGR88374.1 FCD domain-containing protein [Bradyrhizobium sp. ISRA432]
MASILTDRLRQDLLTGVLQPGARLTVKELSDRYEAGAIPLREALSRLSSTGLITAEDQRGFRVTEISEEEVLDIQTQRAELECAALRKSVETGSLQWESDLLAIHHQLAHIQSKLDGGPLASNPEWEAQHCKFHLQLVSACGSKWLLRFIRTLIDHSSRYRQIGAYAILSSEVRRDIAGEHKAILDAALARDADLACALLRSHYRATTRAVVDFIERTRGK